MLPSRHTSFSLATCFRLLALGLAMGCGSPIYVRTASFGGDAGPPLDGVVEPGGSGGTVAGSGGTGGRGSGGILGGSGGAGGAGGTVAIGTGGAGSGGIVGGGGAGGAATGGGSGGSAGSPAGTGGATASGGVGTGGILATGGGGSPTGGKGSGGSGTGGATGGGGAGGTAPVDSARYNFESSVQSWAAPTGTPAFASIAISTAQHAAGQSSLAGSIVASAGATYQLHVQPAAPVAGGSTVTFNVFYPAGAPMASVQPYGIGGASTNYAWYGTSRSVPGGTWNTLTVAIPSAGEAEGLGVQFKLTGAWTGTVYVDAVTW